MQSSTWSYDFLVLYPINPQMLAKYRKAFATSGAKRDATDAQLLLELVSMHRDRLRAWVPDDEQTRKLQMLVEYRRKTVNDRTRLVNRLRSFLKAYFPQALDWAGDLRTVQACDFLRKWPTLEAVRKAKREVLRNFYRQHGCRRHEVIETRIDQMRIAEPLTRDRAIIESSRTMVVATAS